MFPSSGEMGREIPTLLCPLKESNFNHWTCYVLLHLELQTMDKIHKPSGSECYIPSSESEAFLSFQGQKSELYSDSNI
jgi:hypothetical protein